MRHALYLPPFAAYSDPAVVVDLAVAAEDGGWDGLFLWDHVVRPTEPHRAEVGDPWILAAAVATATSRLRIGPMVTPLARRRPQKVARESVTLDRLSGGRLVLGVGLGVNTGDELGRFGEPTDDKARAEVYDEALGLLQALWSGEEVDHHGTHFTAAGVRFLPRPVQQPRIPLWGAARGGGATRPVRRAARLDGLFPVHATLEQLAPMLDVVRAERGDLDGYDVAMEATAAADMEAYAEAGVTGVLRGVDDTRPAATVVAAVGLGPGGDIEAFSD
jgi:alkanesulfonate monooxygenase SsuD/methylene tetrahydromethanopterin reductase-like flavin-dependent oxidoreductase (luciferase family)